MVAWLRSRVLNVFNPADPLATVHAAIRLERPATGPIGFGSPTNRPTAYFSRPPGRYRPAASSCSHRSFSSRAAASRGSSFAFTDRGVRRAHQRSAGSVTPVGRLIHEVPCSCSPQTRPCRKLPSGCNYLIRIPKWAIFRHFKRLPDPLSPKTISWNRFAGLFQTNWDSPRAATQVISEK